MTRSFSSGMFQRSTRPVLGEWCASRSLFIQTDSTPNPNSLKFIPGKQVLPEEYGNSKDFKNFESTNVSPLARRLFKVDGVTNVYLTNDYIAVTRDESFDWEELKLEVFSAIMDFYASGQPAVTDEPPVSDTTIFDDDSEVVAMIKELLETRIRPAIQEDGGDILYSGFDEHTGLVHLTLAGSCSGCPSSEVTLKNGVENMLMHYIPEVR